MLNFMDHRLKPKITCDCVCEDDYPVENLVNSVVPREFIAYSALKPPVSINVQLVCRIYVNCVKIWAKVGSLKSTAFELSGDGQILGYGKCEADSQIGVYFHNPNETQPVVAKFTPILLKNCRKPVSNLKITIRRTKSCAAVVKRLEIWGQPAEKCPEVENLAGSSRSQVQHFEYADSPPQEQEEVKDPDGTPEEFLDAVTCHIMTIPYTLPSGKTIDEKTLERCSQSEAEWGRSPSDPFTGLEYNRNRRPIFNGALKARIDRFLLTNSDNAEFKDTPRTVGTYNIRLDDEASASNRHQTTSFEPPLVGSSFESQLKAAVDCLKKKPPPIVKKCCQQCEKQEHLYEITKCKHLICRNCLLGSKEIRIQCTTANCNVIFSKNEVAKFHVNR